MDPVSAIGVAAGVVGFVEFSFKLLGVAQKCLDDIKNSSAEIKDDLANLERMSENLKPVLKEIQAAYGYPVRIDDVHKTETVQANGGADTKHPAILLYGQSQKIHNDILKLNFRILESERGHISKFFHAGLRKLGHGSTPELGQDDLGPSRPFKDEVNKIRADLENLKTDTILQIQRVLWANSDTTIQELRDISLTQERLTTTTETMNKKLEVIENVWLSGSHSAQHTDMNSKSRPTSSRSQRKVVTPHEMVLDTLWFREIKYREGGIVDAHMKTCRWIFCGPEANDGVISWTDFPTWLRQDSSNIYWIAGKPGSGKSTLIKYILGPGRERLNSNLQQWARDKPLAVAAYYSWSGGKNEQQKSLDGLLRTLIYQILEVFKDLTPRVCPCHWALFKLFGNQKIPNQAGWTRSQLQEAFSTLLTLLQREDYRVAIFIDGLDEFNPSDQEGVVAFIEETYATSPKVVKICAASRPWLEFLEPFKSKPSLRMETLTEGDINSYVHEKFRANLGLEELKQRYGEEQMDSLIKELVEKAEGVFLWVSVATKALSGAMIGGAAMPELRELLCTLPPELRDLYQQVWNGLDDSNKWATFQYIEIVDAHEGPLDVPTMFAAEQPDPYEAATVTPVLQRNQLYRRLLSKARGLLELSGSDIVSYHHRSLNDWLTTNRVQMRDIGAKISDSKKFDANLRLSVAKVAMLLASSPTRWSFWPTLTMCLRYASRVEDRQDLITELAGALDELARFETSSISFQFGGTQIANTVLGITAQFGIMPYVKKKVQENPLLLKRGAHEGEVSILENALCIPGRQLDDFSPEDTYSCSPVSPKDRVELISFLLENKADPNEVSVLLHQLIPVSFRSKRRYRLFESREPTPSLSNKIQQLSTTPTSFPRYNSWFVTTVGSLFKEHPPKKGALHRMMNHMHS